jgi:hypothetical protein
MFLMAKAKHSITAPAFRIALQAQEGNFGFLDSIDMKRL